MPPPPERAAAVAAQADEHRLRGTEARHKCLNPYPTFLHSSGNEQREGSPPQIST
jgi:hypothetical protein